MSTKSRCGLLVLGVAFAAGAAAMVPLAFGNGEPETFSACYQSGSGTLRIDVGSGCRHDEVAIQLSGPVQLPPPRRAFSHELKAPVDVPDERGVVNRVELLDEGAYVIVVQLELQNGDPERKIVACDVGGDHSKVFVGGNTPDAPSMVAVPFVAEAYGPGESAVFCADSGGNVVAYSSTMTAIPVDDIVSNAF